MRRLRDADEGTALIIVVTTAVVLFAMSAFVIDVGALLQERRVLQNGADASALAIAQQCGAGDCGDPAASAGQYTDENAGDGASTVEELCGRYVTGVDECADPPTVPDGAGYVRVTTKTEGDGGTDEVPFLFARLLGVNGATAHSRAVAAWGGPSSLSSELPMTISECEYDTYTDSGDDLEAPPPYSTSGYPSPEATIYLHDTTGASPCPSGGSGSDLPGGFGWLDTGESGCTATSDTEGWFDDKTGRPPPSSCTAALMDDVIGTVVHIPIFDQTNGLSGTNGEYHMSGFAAFYVTGYSIEGQYKVQSLVTDEYPCSGQASCISGFFVQDPSPVTGTIGGPSMGVVVVQLIG
jgi:hypothetical protein